MGKENTLLPRVILNEAFPYAGSELEGEQELVTIGQGRLLRPILNMEEWLIEPGR